MNTSAQLARAVLSKKRRCVTGSNPVVFTADTFLDQESSKWERLLTASLTSKTKKKIERH